MNRIRPSNGGHLRPEEIDLCVANDDGWGRSAWVHEHLRVCEPCTDQIAFVRALDQGVSRLPQPAPSPGFAGRVLGRLELPVPWRFRAWELVKVRWALFATLATAALVLTGGISYWLFAEQGYTPGGLLGVVLGGIQTLALRGAMAVGRLLYEVGLVDAGSSLLESGGMAQALSALALFGTLSLMSLLAMARLIQDRDARARRALNS